MKRSQLLAAICLIGCSGSSYVATLAAQENPGSRNQDVQDRVDSGTANSTSLYNGIYETPWFSDPSIRQQLRLNDAQYDQLNQSYVRSWNRYNLATSQLGRDLTEQERQDRLNFLNNSFYNGLATLPNDVITDSATRQRYRQLYRQYRGYGAFEDPEVQQELNLTDAQRRSIRNAERQWNRKMSDYNRDYVNNPDAVIKRYNEARPEFQERMKTILTPQQQQAWNDLHGERFDIPAQVYFPNGTVTTAKPVLK